MQELECDLFRLQDEKQQGGANSQERHSHTPYAAANGVDTVGGRAREQDALVEKVAALERVVLEKEREAGE